MARADRILVVHESYAQPGGEDVAVAADSDLLEQHGHTVIPWRVENAPLLEWSAPRKATLLARTTWSHHSYRRMRELCERHRPDVVHVHNTLPLLSPAILRAAHRSDAPVVMTLHNYRLVCPLGTSFRAGSPCEECGERSLLRGVVHACYRGSRTQTAAVALMLAAHRRLGTWNECVDVYIALTEFMRSRFIAQGLPPGKIAVRFNPVRDPLPAPCEPRRFALFVGRLSEEKGIRWLLEACRAMPEVRVRIVGGGPLEGLVREAARDGYPCIEALGSLPHAEVISLMRESGALIFPSLCYEGLPMTILESLACGLPVVASRLGAMAEILTDGHDAWLVPPGDARELAGKVRLLMTDDAMRERMGRAARATYEARYSTDRCYEKLMDIYRLAIESARARRTAA